MLSGFAPFDRLGIPCVISSFRPVHSTTLVETPATRAANNNTTTTRSWQNRVRSSTKTLWSCWSFATMLGNDSLAGLLQTLRNITRGPAVRTGPYTPGLNLSSLQISCRMCQLSRSKNVAENRPNTSRSPQDVPSWWKQGAKVAVKACENELLVGSGNRRSLLAATTCLRRKTTRTNASLQFYSKKAAANSAGSSRP